MVRAAVLYAASRRFESYQAYQLLSIYMSDRQKFNLVIILWIIDLIVNLGLHLWFNLF